MQHLAVSTVSAVGLQINFMFKTLNFLRRLPSGIIQFLFQNGIMWQCAAATDLLAKRLTGLHCMPKIFRKNVLLFIHLKPSGYYMYQ